MLFKRRVYFVFKFSERNKIRNFNFHVPKYFTQLKVLIFLFSVASADRSMYHALGHSTILYIQAVMTFDMVGVDILFLGSINICHPLTISYKHIKDTHISNYAYSFICYTYNGTYSICNIGQPCTIYTDTLNEIHHYL